MTITTDFSDEFLDDMSNWEDMIELDEYPDLPDFYEEDESFEFTKECPYCKGTGISRDVEADCLTCYGEGYI